MPNNIPKLLQQYIEAGGKIKDIPDSFRCSLNHEPLTDPVLLPRSGLTCNRVAIVAWLEKNPTDPFTKEPLTKKQLSSNLAVVTLFEDFLRKK